MDRRRAAADPGVRGDAALFFLFYIKKITFPTKLQFKKPW
jgi:hypothetical protein